MVTGCLAQRVHPRVDSRVLHHQALDLLIAHLSDPDRLDVLQTHILKVMLKCYLHRPMTLIT